MFCERKRRKNYTRKKVSNDNEFTGDPTETALTDIGFKLGYNKEFLNIERQDEIPFDSDRKLMTIVIEKEGKYLVYTKGAVDELLKRCGSYALNGEVKSDLENYVNTINEQNKNIAILFFVFLSNIFYELQRANG